MNMVKSKRLARWFAKQLGSLPGGFAAAAHWPESPIDQNRLSACARGDRKIVLEEAIFFADANDVADLFRSLADLIDGGIDAGDLERISRKDLYDSARLAEQVEAALQDGHLSCGEIAELKGAADQNLANAVRVSTLIEKLQSGPQE